MFLANIQAFCPECRLLHTFVEAELVVAPGRELVERHKEVWVVGLVGAGQEVLLGHPSCTQQVEGRLVRQRPARQQRLCDNTVHTHTESGITYYRIHTAALVSYVKGVLIF